MNIDDASLSIVLPCYNEERALPFILACFDEVFAGKPIELILVDNGSTDNTQNVLVRELNAKPRPKVRTVHIPVNCGYGYGILTGLRSARSEYLAWTHADLQTDLSDVWSGFTRLMASPSPHLTLLRGCRIGRGKFDAFFTWGMGVVASWVLGMRLRDVNAQPKLFHRSLLDFMQDAPEDFSLDLYLLFLAQRLGWAELEHPVHFKCRLHGQSKGGGTLLGKIRLSIRTLRYILKLQRDFRSGKCCGSVT